MKVNADGPERSKASILNAERKLLAEMLVDNSKIARRYGTYLRADAFHYKAHRIIHKVVVDAYHKWTFVGPVVLFGELRKKGYLSQTNVRVSMEAVIDAI